MEMFELSDTSEPVKCWLIGTGEGLRSNRAVCMADRVSSIATGLLMAC